MEKAIFIQARSSSTRFPQKMFAHLLPGIELVQYVYQRCLRSKQAGNVVVLTSDDKSDDNLAAYCINNNLKVFRGPLDNVLKRFVSAAEFLGVDAIGRVCGDTPFIDVALIDESFRTLQQYALDYAAPSRNTCASGFYSETVTAVALKKSLELAESKSDLEHVTKYILENITQFKVMLLDAKLKPAFLETIRFTIDYPEDLDIGSRIANALTRGFDFTSQDVIKIIKQLKS